jgi:PAS domain S-box-containing protein
MPGETRAPRALLLTCTELHGDSVRAVLAARGWSVTRARQEEAGPLVERDHFSLTVVELLQDQRCRTVHELCRAAGQGAGHLLLITAPSRLEEAANLVAEGGGDLIVTPFDHAQLHARIALAEARLNMGVALAAGGDAAARLQALERSLRYHRASLEELFQHAPEGIAIVDEHDRVIRINDEFTRMFGYPAEEAIGRPVNELIAPEHLMDEAMALTTGVRTQKLVVEDTMRRHSDGSLLDVSILAAPIAVGEGLDGAFAIYRDISERKAQERALQASEARYRSLLEQAERVNAELRDRTQEIETSMAAKSRLYSALNHELRTPISAVMLYQELLLAGSMGELQPEQRDALERSHSAARHLLDVVRDVLDLSKIEAGGAGARSERVDAGELMREIVVTAQPLAQLHGSPIDLRVDPDLPPLHTDAQKLRQIVLNLLSNAAKFGRGETIRLHCRSSDDGAGFVIEVHDQGIGIEASNQSLIFEDFVQVEEGRGGGTGLGLAISRRLAGVLGGKLEVESELGTGSTFRLTLPSRGALAATMEEAVTR